MFSALSSLFSSSSPSYDSIILLIHRPLSGYTCFHPVPEEVDVVEEFTTYSGTPTASLRLPSSVKAIISREVLGEIAVRATDGESFTDVSNKLADYIRRFYTVDTETGCDDLGSIGKCAESSGFGEGKQNLQRSEQALGEGFNSIVRENEKQQSEGSGALPIKYTVELVRISRKHPGRVVDDSDLTSFPRRGPAL
ncbi:hypothetical protein C8Q75DRAFT_805035 [Abortiporus biennis]|nr:hypothetical protein C8Q75DRAFT_805035 [Abortiporus biennis]